MGCDYNHLQIPLESGLFLQGFYILFCWWFMIAGSRTMDSGTHLPIVIILRSFSHGQEGVFGCRLLLAIAKIDKWPRQRHSINIYLVFKSLDLYDHKLQIPSMF